MKPSKKSVGGLAGAMALSCVLGLAPQQAGASIALNGCGDASSNFGTACGLDELVSGGSILINGLTLFSNFGLTGPGLNAAAIRVDAIDTLYNPGLRLVSNGPLVSGSAQDNLVYDVTLDPGTTLWIKDNSLEVAVGGVSNGSVADVFETVYDGLFNVIGDKDVFCDSPSCENKTTLVESDLSSRVTALTALMGVNVTTADVNSVTMQFSQVPEPGSLALLALGVAGLGAISRRRRQSAAR